MKPQNNKPNRWAAIIGSAMFVVVCGLAAPRLLQSPTPEPTPSAKSTDSPKSSPNTEPPPIGGILVRLTVGTIVVLALCGAVTYGIARRQKGKPADTSGPMSIVGTLPVGRGVVHTVRVGDHRLLVSIDATGLRSLILLPSSTVEVDEPIVFSERVSVTTTPSFDREIGSLHRR